VPAKIFYRKGYCFCGYNIVKQIGLIMKEWEDMTEEESEYWDEYFVKKTPKPDPSKLRKILSVN